MCQNMPIEDIPIDCNYTVRFFQVSKKTFDDLGRLRQSFRVHWLFFIVGVWIETKTTKPSKTEEVARG